jgi:hypothetical protein
MATLIELVEPMIFLYGKGRNALTNVRYFQDGRHYSLNVPVPLMRVEG